MNVIYQLEPNLAVAEFTDVLQRSTLAERRPMTESATLQTMLKNADVLVTARRRAAGRCLAGHHRFRVLHVSFGFGGR